VTTAAKVATTTKTIADQLGDDKKSREPRIKWEKLWAEKVDKDGTSERTYPWLLADHYHLDDFALRAVAFYSPHKAPYGTQTAAWELAVVMCQQQRSPDDDTLLFPTMNAAKLKKRFNDWIEFIRQQRAKALKDSGTDDELSDMYELYALMEQIYDEHKEMEQNKSNKTMGEAQKAIIEKASAEVLKCRASGIPIPEETIAILSKGKTEDGVTPAKRSSLLSSLTSSKKRKEDPTAEKLNGLAASQASRNQMSLLKEQRLSRSMELREKERVRQDQLRTLSQKDITDRRSRKDAIEREKIELQRESNKLEHSRLKNESERIEIEKRKTEMALEQHTATMKMQASMQQMLARMMEQQQSK